MADSRRAWARALFAAGKDSSTRLLFGEALAGLARAMEGPGGFREGLEDPAVPKLKRLGLIEAALPASASAPSRKVFGRFAELIVNKGRVALLPAISRSYGELADAEAGIARLDIEAARQPDAALIESLTKAWGAAGNGERVFARVRIQPDLIGGYRLRSGSVRYDYSIAGRIERLRRHLARPLEAARDKG